MDDLGDPVREHLAVRRAAGLVDLGLRDRLWLTGADRESFLQRMVTNDVAAAREVGGCYAALLTAKGRMVADLRVHLRPDGVLVDLEPGLADPVRVALEHYVVADDVEIEDARARWTHLGLHGPSTPDLLAGALGEADAEPYRPTAIPVEGGELLAVGSRRLGEAGYDLFVSPGAAEAVAETLLEAGALPFGPAAYETLRIEAGVPAFGIDMDGSSLPAEAIEDEAISYGKGCYVGQEIVVRIHTRNVKARHLVRLAIEGDILPESGIQFRHGESTAGRVTSSARIPPDGRILALGYVTRRFVEHREGFSVPLPDGTTTTVHVCN